MKHLFIESCLLVFIAFVNVGGCGGAVIIVSDPVPPLDSDFVGGTVIVVAEEASSTVGITSNGDQVIIVIEDGDENFFALVGLATSSTECEILMFTLEKSEGFNDADGKCRIDEDGTFFILEEVVYAGRTFDLRGEITEGVPFDSDDMNIGGPISAQTERILGFQAEILHRLEGR